MKKLLFLFLFSLSFYAQNDSIVAVKPKLSVIGLDKVNIVYRGVTNYLTVSVPNNKGFNVIAPGLQGLGNGKFILRPGVGKTIDLLVNFKDDKDKLITEKHTLRIKNLSQPIGLLNGNNCSNCLVLLKKDEIKKSIISTKIDDFLFFDLDSDFFKVNSFEIKISEKKIIKIEGNTFNEEAVNELYKLNKGSQFEIINIDFGPNCLDCLKRKVYPIKVILEE